MYSASGEKTKWVYTSGLTALSSCGDSTDTLEAPQKKYTAVSLKGCSLGTATVTLKSDDGQRTYGSATVTVRIPKAPAPDNVSGQIFGTSANVTWDEVPGATTDDIEYNLHYTDGTTEENVNTSDTSRSVLSLERNKTYTFKVRARGDGTDYNTAWGDWSNFYIASTFSVGAPVNLKVESRSLHSIEVKFKPVGGAVAYRFRHKPTSATETDWVTGARIELPSDGEPIAPVGGLQDGTPYTIGIQLYGDGKRYISTPGPWNHIIGVTYSPLTEIGSEECVSESIDDHGTGNERCTTC